MSTASGAGPIPLPARISKYELLEFLGGGMSHVFRARDTVLGRTVAIKILTPAGVADPDTKARFLQEARTASNISHENILAVYDFGEEAGKPYMVMEFLRGRTVRAAIQERIVSDVPGKLKVAIQVARALSYVHQNGIVHRDVKPENINLDDSGRAKLMDFGIAKSADLSLTQPGYVLGTPYYMAPEQIIGKPVTPAVDIYAFGIMLYEMMLGTRPYSGATIETIFFKIIQEPLDLAPLAAAGIPPEVVEIIARCTRKEAAERYPNFDATVSELESALGTQAVPNRPAAVAPEVAPPRIRSKVPLWIGLGIALLVLLAIAIFWNTRASAPKASSSDKKVAPPVAALPQQIETSSGPMRLVEGGSFQFGADKQKAQTGPFYIDQTEVSNQVYAAFCAATQHALPEGFNTEKPRLPVVRVTIADARAFAKWAGKRLPNAKEWEKAARGSNGRTYPWGEDKDPAHANVLDNPTFKRPGPQPVEAFPESADPYSVLNMVGNVWELVDEPWTPNFEAINFFTGLLSPLPTTTEPWVSARGGSYKMALTPRLVWDAFPLPERFSSDVIGFRCVKDAK